MFNKQQISNISKKIQIMLFITHIIILAMILVQAQGQNQCCLRLEATSCLACPEGTHLYRGNCLNNVDNCTQYVNGFDCIGCQTGYQLDADNGECVKISEIVVPVNDFVEEIINIRDPMGPNALAYTLSVDFLKSMQPELFNAEPIGAVFRTYTNLSTQLLIQFQTNNNFYTATVVTNLQSFIFELLSFRTIPIPELSTNKIQLIDKKNKIHMDNIRLIEIQARNINPNLATLNGGRITTNHDGSITVNMVYLGTVTGDQFQVSALIGLDKKVNGLIIKQTPLPGKVDVPALMFTPIDVANTDDFYLITLDFVGSQIPKYQSINPTKAQVATQALINTYKLTFMLADNSTYEVICSINTQNFVLRVQKQTQISLPTSAMKQFERVRKQEIFLDFQFILLYEAINKEFNDKFKDATIKALDRSQDSLSVQYYAYFQIAPDLWQVSGEINKNTFSVSNLQQTKIKSIPASMTVIPSQNTTLPNITTPNITTPNPNTNITTPNPNVTIPGPNLPDGVTNALVGMSRATAEDLKGPDFLQVQDALNLAKIKELKNAKLLAVYLSNSSFTSTYAIYHKDAKNPHIYETKVTKDNLRKKVYFLSFTQIS